MPPDVFDGDQCISNMIACFRRKTIFEIPPIRYNSVFTRDADVLAKLILHPVLSDVSPNILLRSSNFRRITSCHGCGGKGVGCSSLERFDI